MGKSPTRRGFFHVLTSGILFIISGCTSRSQPSTPQQEETPERSPKVPDRLQQCTDLGGNQRDPENLAAKDKVQYQYSPEGAEQCSNCRFFCEDPAGDFIGACTVVEGEVRTSDWCELYEPIDRVGDNPTIAGTH